ncbi:hypothetical protein ACA910_019655 [Epithemia clementina (nom. ined.)]
MPNWEGIEDASGSPSRVWLARPKQPPDSSSLKDADQGATDCTKSATSPNAPPNLNKKRKDNQIWKPIRKCDCQAINAAGPNASVLIDGGRATADPARNLIFPNFIGGRYKELLSAFWFVREEKSKNNVILDPVSHAQDSAKIEALYQKAVSAASSLGSGISTVLNDEITLSDGSKVKIRQHGGSLSMQKTPKGWFSSSLLLQRGYDEYTIEGEEEETTLGPVRHVVFIVHGIGEAVFSRDDVNIPDLVDMTNSTRIAVQKKQVKEWKRHCEKAKKDGQPLPPPPNRIEFLPIQWFNQLHDSSSELMKSLKAVSLTSIPALRSIANDIVFDVLLYLTPSFCGSVIKCVTGQINQLLESVKKIHPDFVAAGGEYSLVGHSLGSVIVWDILSILKDSREKAKQSSESSFFKGLTFNGDENVGYHAYAKNKNANTAQNGTWGPTLPTGFQDTIHFEPKVTVLLGSPLGMFLTMRGAHAVFDAMRKSNEATTTANGGKKEELAAADTASPFTLPTKSLYNVFNPSDPVAYRVEPLLLPQDADPGSIPPPEYLTAPGKDVRLHLKARQIGDEIRKSIMEPSRGSFTSFFESAVSVFSSQVTEAEAHDSSSPQQQQKGEPTSQKQSKQVTVFPLGGASPRVDYSLQPGIIDNEYISAVLAHSTSTYFLHEDFLEFMIDKFSG